MSIGGFIQVSRELYRNRIVFAKPYRKKTERKSFSSSAADDLNSSGLHVVRNFVSEAECARLRKVIDNVWSSVAPQQLEELRQKCLDIAAYKRGVEQPKGYRLWVDRHFSDHRINGAELLDEGINAFAFNSDFINMGESHLGTILKTQFCLANKVEYKQDNLGSGGGWHRDNCYARGFKCMLYLNDVTSDDGPFQFIPGSHTWSFHLFTENAIGKYQFTPDEVDAICKSKKTKPTEVTAKAGDLVLFDTNIIHRGKPIAEGHFRYALTNYYHYK